jgi:anti-anti-sigma factor
MRTSWLTHPAPDSDGLAVARFHVETVPDRDMVRVSPVGDVDVSTVGEIRRELRHLRHVGFTRLVLDLSGTTFLDSTGLHLILEEYAAARADGAQLALVAGPPEVQRIFDLTGLGAQLPFSDEADLRSGAAWA